MPLSTIKVPVLSLLLRRRDLLRRSGGFRPCGLRPGPNESTPGWSFSRDPWWVYSPLPPHRWAYQLHPPLAFQHARYEVIDGDMMVIDGVPVHLTPTHTAGMRGVAVQPRGQRLLRTGNNVSLRESWNAAEAYGTAHWVGPLHVDLESFCRSLKRIEQLGDVIIPGYDWAALDPAEYGSAASDSR